MKTFVMAFVLCFVGSVGIASAQYPLIFTIPNVNCDDTVKGSTAYTASSFQLGGTAGAGATSIPDLSSSGFTITRNFDQCSEQLVKLFLSGAQIPKLTLSQNIGAPNLSIVITLTNAKISKYSVVGANSALPTEVLGLAYAQICIASTSDQGTVTGPVPAPTRISVCYDGPGNVVTTSN